LERSCRAKLEAFDSDGRSADPGSVVAGDPRDGLLDGFLGLDASGSWTLFAADLSGGDSHILTGWSMEIIGVPEPGTTSLLAFSVLALFARRKR
jgi:subtilisin-like proprotein convertase family protein